MYALTIYLDTSDEQAADQARSDIVVALGGAGIEVPYGVDADGPTKVEGSDDDT